MKRLRYCASKPAMRRLWRSAILCRRAALSKPFISILNLRKRLGIFLKNIMTNLSASRIAPASSSCSNWGSTKLSASMLISNSSATKSFQASNLLGLSIASIPFKTSRSPLCSAKTGTAESYRAWPGLRRNPTHNKKRSYDCRHSPNSETNPFATFCESSGA